MLLRFGVSNHLSIHDFQELLFTASALKDPAEGLIPCPAAPSGAVVPAVVIYGANASGKSNIVDALMAMRNMVLHSHPLGKPDGGVPRRPFALYPQYAESLSRFEIDFVLDGVRYHYGFEASDTVFESEWLYAYPKSYRRVLFERDGKDFQFGRGLGGRNSVIRDLTRRNSLYVSAAAQNGHQLISKIHGYFRSIHVERDIAISGREASRRLSTGDLDRRVIDFLQKIDTGIVDYRRKKMEKTEQDVKLEREVNQFLAKITGIEEAEIEPSEKSSFELAHRGKYKEPVYFELDRESAGTRRLLVMLKHVFQVIDDGAPIVVDELDASLHTHACEAVLKLFCSSEKNPHGAQLIATTHDTNGMESPVLRRDQLWFTEKDDVGATRLYPLTDIRTSKGDNIERGYLQGRYGATPRDRTDRVHGAHG